MKKIAPLVLSFLVALPANAQQQVAPTQMDPAAQEVMRRQIEEHMAERSPLGFRNTALQAIQSKKSAGQALTQEEQATLAAFETDKVTVEKNEKSLQPVCRMSVKEGEYKGASLSTSFMPSCNELTKEQLKSASYIVEEAASNSFISIEGEKPRYRYRVSAEEIEKMKQQNVQLKQKWAGNQ